jgi:hypothetical protein
MVGFMRRLLPRRPSGHDFVGYEALIDFMRERSLHRLEGDLAEIGSFMGGGTAKLARFARKHAKRVYAIDIFDPNADRTPADDGTPMSDIYNAFLEGHSQLDVYQEAIRGLDNVVTIQADSAIASLPEGTKLVFGFIDGNHHTEYVRSDFRLVWQHLVPGGAVGFHDYGSGLPDVTRCIDELIAAHSAEIGETREIPDKHIMLLVRAGAPSGR